LKKKTTRYLTKIFFIEEKMTGQTKMIIITSDEDIIRKFSLNKTKNTQIIDLDNDKQTTSNETNVNNMIHIALLAELSQPVCILFRFN
jgi:hypothetical protein